MMERAHVLKVARHSASLHSGLEISQRMAKAPGKRIPLSPEAVVFSSGRVPIRAMVAHGFFLNLAAVAWITLYLHFVGLPLLGVEMP